MNKALLGFALPLLASATIISSCGTGGKLTSKIKNTDTLATTPDSALLLANSIMNKRMDFTSFNGKAKIHYTGKDQKQELTANIRIKKDSVIWMSVTAMGFFQVARLMVTPDSVKLINYMEKKVTKLSAADGEKLLNAPIRFNTLQSLLLGTRLSEQGAFASIVDSASFWKINTIDTNAALTYTYNKVDTTIMYQHADIIGNIARAITMLQTDYSIDKKTGISFSKDRKIEVKNGTDMHLIELNYNGADFNEPVSFPFSYSDKFTEKGIK